ncbi:MAG: hypothetical protein PUC33_04990 [Oscillospiraceae bacterium]|nr:hypothetical protein [Oscillospiraceae bacterium]
MNRSFKKLCSLMLALLMIVTAVPFASLGSSADEFGYELVNDGEAYGIFSYKGSDKDVVIPSEYNGKSVVALNSSVFNGKDIESVTIPVSITAVGQYVFYFGCDNLKYVFYAGTEAQWKAISIASGNSKLTDAAIHYETTDHTYVRTVTTEPQCEEKGVATYACSVCGLSYTEEIDAKGHAAELETVPGTPASCTETGTADSKKCPDCGKIIEQGGATEALGHNFDETNLITDTDPTCAVDGSGHYKCTRCEAESEAVVIPATGKHTEETVTGYAATCTEAGKADEVICSVCKAHISGGEEIPAKGHDFTGELKIDKQPNCGIEGSGHHVCKVCGADSEPVSIAPVGEHTQETVKGTAATCTEAGKEDEVICSVCGTHISGGEEIPALGHDFTGEPITVKEATCGEDGSGYRVCTREDCEEQESFTIPATGNHSWNTQRTTDQEPTCKEAGSASIHCLVCNAIKPDSQISIDIDPDAHQWGDEEIIEPDTCTEKGKAKKTCELCGISMIYDVDEITGHDNGEMEIYAKVENGKKMCQYGIKCKVCGFIQFFGDIAETEHAMGDTPIKSTPATCMKTGSAVYQCTKCDYTKEVSLPVDEDAHAYSAEFSVIDEPYCGVAGTKARCCTNIDETGKPCSAVTDVITISAKEHYASDDAYVVTEPATCVATGLAEAKCKCEKATLTRVVPIDSSNHSSEPLPVGAVKATCKDEGYSGDLVCPACQKMVKEGSMTPVDPENHIGETYLQDEKAATCGAKGYTGDTYCSGCDALLESGEEISATGNHDFAVDKEKTVVATCTETGTTVYVCTVCDATKSETTEIDPDNHDFSGEIIVDQAPTCTEEGAGHYVCARCDAVKNEAIPMAAHTYETVDAKLPTCVEDGCEAYEKCAVCGAVKGEIVTVPATGKHIYNSTYEIDFEPTCINPGQKSMHCKFCGAIYEATITLIPATNQHEYGEWEVVKTATIAKDGLKKRTCVNEGCTASETEVIPRLKSFTLSDEANGVIIEYTEGTFGLYDVSLSVEEFDGNDYFKIEYTRVKGLRIGVLPKNGETPLDPTSPVYVKIKLPDGFSLNTTDLFTKDIGTSKLIKIEAEYNDGYLCFMADELGDLVIVDIDSVKAEEPEEPEDPTANCDCLCHRTDFFGKFLYVIVRIFWHLFGNNTCKCGVAH